MKPLALACDQNQVSFAVGNACLLEGDGAGCEGLKRSFTPCGAERSCAYVV